MKKLVTVLLLAAMLCLTGCVGQIENAENLATSDVLQIKITNERIGMSGDGLFFSKEEMAAAKRIALFGHATISGNGISQTVPAEKISVHSAEIKEDVSESYVILNVPYKGLEMGKEYMLDMTAVRIALEGDTPVTEEDAQQILGGMPPFTPVRIAVTPSPTPAPTPVPEIPATGDSMNFALPAVLAAAGVIGMTVLLRRKNEV